MRSSVLALFAAAAVLGANSGQEYRMALPGYRFEFPGDYFNHPEFRTEWWYYTGNLRSAEGRRFGFELTFFRHSPNERPRAAEGVWDLRNVWMAHLALSDLDGRQFLNQERMNRSGAGLAGVDYDMRTAAGKVWNGNWSVNWILDPHTPAAFAQQRLQAVGDRFTLNLAFRSEKPPTIHGTDGVSQKSAGAGHASHYVSLTRLITSGQILFDGKTYSVEGSSWMDHEFFSHMLDTSQTGWDWFSLQFDDGSELMLYRLRRNDGSVEPFSSGTWVDDRGSATHLRLSDFDMQPGRRWVSSVTNARYPVEWTIRVPSLSLACTVSSKLDAQELQPRTSASPTYWEGAVQVSGTRGSKAAGGSGYLEMTGYAAGAGSPGSK